MARRGMIWAGGEETSAGSERLVWSTAQQTLSATGVVAGRGANTHARDLLTGRSFFRYSSHSDDAAQQVEELREEERQGREEQKRRLERIARALEERKKKPWLTPCPLPRRGARYRRRREPRGWGKAPSARGFDTGFQPQTRGGTRSTWFS